VKKDVHLLDTVTAGKDAIEIIVIDINEQYQHLASSATLLFCGLLEEMATNSAVFKNYYPDIVQQCQVVGVQVWSAIAETRINGTDKEKALSI
jgi:hypothetical protein